MGRVTGSNVEIVRSVFEGYEREGIEGVLETMDENIVIEIPPELSAEPDDYRGHDGVRRYFAGFDGMIDDVRYEADRADPGGRRGDRAHPAQRTRRRAAGWTWIWTRSSYTSSRTAGSCACARTPDLERDGGGVG